jgi:hypothetical protein
MIVLLFIVIIVAIIVFLVKKENKLRKDFNIPGKAKKVDYYQGYTTILSSKIYFWDDNSELYFCDPKHTTNIKISKDSIISFNMVGEYHESTSTTGGGVKGGGTSIGGAVVGGVLLGPVGAIIGSRKKVKSKPIKTTTHVTDTRKVILKFKENDMEKGMVLDKIIFDVLSFICPEKKIA